jgi:hypothetical protein
LMVFIKVGLVNKFSFSLTSTWPSGRTDPNRC